MEFKFRSNAKVVFILITDAPYRQGNSVTKRYIPSNPSFDNTWRNVEIIIDGMGKANSKYKSASNVMASSPLIEKTGLRGRI